jgi:beta-lactam-binding protein with PASTA domain/tRNA A-37 threonylcarbamoyl transferase component Bud32
VRDITQPRLLGGRYELDGVVGRGGMAEVYRARDIRLDRVVAVKTLREDLARDQTFQARFRREAQSAASLNHPSIVAVYDTGEDMSGQVPVPYIVMEYVDGRTLRDLLRDDRRLLPERALEIADGVLRALDYSHRGGIVHRDIKPGNVMLTRSGQVKVMDFGIARAVSDAQATMTQTAQVIGTAQYLSPEQARGERVDARSDLYSTGCLLYELFTGRPPFTGDSPVAIAYQHVRENPVPPTRLDPELPAWADSIVLKAMAKDPADRYQSAGEMRGDIQRALSGMPVAAPMRPENYQGTRRMGTATQLAGPTAAIPPYQYGPEEEPPADQERRRKVWPWVVTGLVIVALIVLGLLGLHFITGNGAQYSVPNVVGMPLNAAEQQIHKSHLTFRVVRQPSASTTKGHVISTRPAAGSSEPKGTQVTLVVSSGPPKPKTVAMPSVLGEQASTAESTLQGSPYFFQVRERADPSSTAPEGTVVRQQPRASTAVNPHSTVTIYVSGGGVQVPSVIHDTPVTAEQILQNAGLTPTLKIIQGPSGWPVNTVFQQYPGPSVTVAKGSTVTLYVAAAPSPTPSSSPSPTPTSPSPQPSGG